MPVGTEKSRETSVKTADVPVIVTVQIVILAEEDRMPDQQDRRFGLSEYSSVAHEGASLRTRNQRQKCPAGFRNKPPTYLNRVSRTPCIQVAGGRFEQFL